MESVIDKGNKAKRPTSIDVARRAGVSQTTVSLVMRSKGGAARISSETQAKVWDAARDLMYFPNELVRSIRKGRTGIVGLYARDRGWAKRNSYWSATVAEMHEAASEREVELLLFSHHSDASSENLLRRMLSGLVDGLIVQPTAGDTLIEDVARSGLPMVCVGDVVPGVPSVAIENERSVEALVDHLAAQGHRSLAMINMPESRFGSQGERQRAYVAACDRHGLRAGPKSVVLSSVEGTPEAIDAVLALPSGPTAIVCVNDEYAYHAVRRLLALGLDVPGQMAVSGFDGIPMPLVPLEVTSMRSPIEEMCRIALDTLNDLVLGRPISEPVVRLPTRFVRGQTS